MAKKQNRPGKNLRKNKKISTRKADSKTWSSTTEEALTSELSEDLFDAWIKLKDFAVGLGEQRVYASGKAIMFSKKVCYFFVRPKKSYIEVVIFLPDSEKFATFAKVTTVSKTKFAHTFKLIHPDQVEDELTDAVRMAYTASV